MAEKILDARIQQKADLAETWKTKDPVLLENELAIESDTGKMKLGDGTSSYLSLPYLLYGSFTTAPDRDNIGTTNLIDDNEGTWTANADGYVQIQMMGSGYGNVLINGNVELQVQGVPFDAVNTIEVTKDDVVKIVVSDSFVSCACYFIPLKYRKVTFL